MTRDQIEGRWKQFMGALKEKWGRLAGDNTTIAAGICERLEGSLQERHGYGKDPANADLRLEGAGRWKTLNAQVEIAFGDLRAVLECDAERGAPNQTYAPALQKEQ